MGRKKNKQVVTKKKEEREVSPFSNIVLKEKVEPEVKKSPQKKPISKKPGEIVQGYNPSMSFADILYSFEHTGNPYSMPKPKASQKEVKEDFGAILDAWEGKGKKKVQKRVENVKNTYQPTKSFGEILSSFESGFKPKEEISSAKKKEDKVSVESLFRSEDEDNKIAPGVTWSILGGKQERPNIKKEDIAKEDEKKPKFKRTSKPYKPEKDFSSILDQYEGKKEIIEVEEEKKVIAQIIEEKKQEIEEPIAEISFFRTEDEDNKVGKNVSWSILGGKNDSFVRPVIKKEEQVIEVKKVSNEKKYKPEQAFSTILDSFDKTQKKSINFSGEKPQESIKTFDEILKEKGDSAISKPQYTLTKLRTMPPQATLDLHGETQVEAEKLVNDFLSECVENHLRKICIITGKGLHSETGEGVLRSVTEKILEESGMVSEKNNAPLNAGGSGALWIILKA